MRMDSRSQEGTSGGSGWVGIHLHHHGDPYGVESDRIVLKVAVPMARHFLESGMADRWFFIRYGDGGSHVRLRLHGPIRAIESELEETFRGFVGSDVTLLAGHVELRRVPYVPETARYGGPKGVLVAEQFFHASSEATAALLAAPEGCEPSARLGTATLAMAVLLHAMLGEANRAVELLVEYGARSLHAFLPDRERAGGWERAFGEAYERQASTLMPFLAEAWRRLDESEPLGSALDRYHDAAARIRGDLALLAEGGALGGTGPAGDEVDRVEALVPSYLHMTNNRLGVAPQSEIYLAQLLARILGMVVEGRVEAAQ